MTLGRKGVAGGGGGNTERRVKIPANILPASTPFSPFMWLASRARQAIRRVYLRLHAIE
jgi:hypothetical protein